MGQVLPASARTAPSASDDGGNPERIARFGLVMLLVAFGGFLLWASLAPLDQGLVGNGSVVVAGERKVVQAPQEGVVDAILVRDGDRVEQGQLLIQQNTVRAQAQLDVTLGRFINARSIEARLTAERLGNEGIDWPADLLEQAADPRAQAAMALQENLFRTRREELASRLQILRHELAGQEEQLAGYRSIRQNQERQLTLQQRELEGIRGLAADGYVPRNRLFEAERHYAQLSAVLASTLGEIGRLGQQINETRMKSLQQEQSFRSEVETELTRVAAEASTHADQLRALRFELEHASIRAPVAGQVMALAVHTLGAVTPAGERLLDIVPQDSAWQVKAQFPPLVVDRLAVGLPVDLRFSSLQRVHTPVLLGVVTTVSADQLVDEKTGLSYFSVGVDVEPQSVAELAASGLEIKPGMQVEVIVRTGERTLMNYLLKPLTERLVTAFKEE